MGDASTVQRIPREFYKKSGVMVALGVAYALALWAVPLVVLNLVWGSSLGLATQLIVSIPLVVVSAQGLVLLGFLAHDGTHLNLHSDKRVSMVLAILLTLPLWPHSEIGFSIHHWNHHRFTNTASDPDSACYGRFKSFPTRLLFARFAAMGGYFEAMLRVAVGLPLGVTHRLPFSDTAVKWLARFNLLTWIVALGILVMTYVRDPSSFYLLLSVVLVAIGILALNPYIEHAGTDVGHGQDTRSRLGWWWTIFYLGQNHHLIHHLYPSVPFYNLAKVHAHLVERGFFGEEHNRHVSHGLFGTYRHALGASPYPGATAPDDTFDVVGESLASSGEKTTFTNRFWAQADLERELARHNYRGWEASARACFLRSITDEAFPCDFARVTARTQTLYFAFIDDVAEPAAATIVARYIDRLDVVQGRDAAFHVLVIAVRPNHDMGTVEAHQRAQAFIDNLAAHDPGPWPPGASRDPHDPAWQFFFRGVPIFVNVNVPSYTQRRSRNLGPGLVFVIQARDAFDQIAGRDPSGVHIRERIRSRIDEFDAIPRSPCLAYYGNDDCLESTQFMLGDDNATPIMVACPGQADGHAGSPQQSRR